MGAQIDEIGDHSAKVSLIINEHHKNAMGGVMGGVYFTLADFAFAVASNWQNPGVVGVNVDASFIGVPKSEKIFYIWGHSYEFDINDEWDKFEEFCKYIANRSDIFYGTNKEILL